MDHRHIIWTVALALGLAQALSAQTADPKLPTAVDRSVTLHGPAAGHLVIIGGGEVPDGIWDAFVRYAGGRKARMLCERSLPAKSSARVDSIMTIILPERS